MTVYNVEWLTSLVECDAILKSANDDLATVNSRIGALQRSLDNKLEKGPEITGELESLEDQLPTINSLADSLPEGKERDKTRLMVKRLEMKQIILGTKIEDYNVVARLETQLDLAIAKLIGGEITAFIAAVEARKTALPAA